MKAPTNYEVRLFCEGKRYKVESVKRHHRHYTVFVENKSRLGLQALGRAFDDTPYRFVRTEFRPPDRRAFVLEWKGE